MTDDRFYGYTPEAWSVMVDAGYRYLCNVASRPGTTDYSSLCRELRERTGITVDPHDHALAHLLGDMGRRSHEERGVVVTVLVHYKGGSEPGPGLFTLCQEIGLLPAGALGADTKLRFQVEHTQAVIEAYSRRRRP